MKKTLAAALLSSIFAGTAEAKLKVVASFSILGDIVSNVGGDDIELSTIVGPESDAHAYEPKPDDAKAMAAADVVFVNGLGFEGWQQRLVEASGFRKTLVSVSTGITAAQAEDDHAAFDPHAWQDVANVKIYVSNIVSALCNADAPTCGTYKENAVSYTMKLDHLDAQIRSTIARIPDDRRMIITSHDAFGYFAKAYAISFRAPEGISTESEASAKDVARLIEQIRNEKASALFVENISDPRLLQQIAAETGLKIDGVLYSDALSSSEGPASTYIAMMRHNVKTLASSILTQ
jgi:zinc/manganese transport system substrate-binding protein